MARVNPGFLVRLKEQGAFDVSACFNCGVCTATCPLTSEGWEFPRKLIRYAELGMESKLVSSPELWLCYNCGECTTTCPRSADPAGFMMTARRYATMRYGWGRISDLLYRSKIALSLTLATFTIILAGLIAAFHGPIVLSRVDIFSFLPMQAVDQAGMLVGVFIGLSVLANLFIMYRLVSKESEPASDQPMTRRAHLWLAGLVNVVFREILAQKRYATCNKRNRFYAHLTLVWGFIGLLIATTLAFIVDVHDAPISSAIPQAIGILSGAALIYGSVYFIYKRIKRDEEFAAFSHFSDWAFLIFMFLAGLTGFLLDLSFFAGAPMPTYILYAIHLIVVFNILIIAPFTKFAHAIFRPLALWIMEVRTSAIRVANAPVLSEVRG